MSGARHGSGATTRVSAGKKRSRSAWEVNAGTGDESDGSDSAGSVGQRTASRPKKRFIWPEVHASLRVKPHPT